MLEASTIGSHWADQASCYHIVGQFMIGDSLVGEVHAGGVLSQQAHRKAEHDPPPVGDLVGLCPAEEPAHTAQSHQPRPLQINLRSSRVLRGTCWEDGGYLRKIVTSVGAGQKCAKPIRPALDCRHCKSERCKAIRGGSTF